jgi:hypothetical protein
MERKLVLLGGPFAEPVGDLTGAYVLRQATLGEAEATAAQDPLVHHEVICADVVEWLLVGIDPDLIDPSLT